MPKKSLKKSVVAVLTFGICFGAGFGGAHAGAALETRSAVAQARAAATAVNVERDALEDSLLRAQAAIRASAFAPDDDSVVDAAADVEQAAEAAHATTDTHQAVLASAEEPAGAPTLHPNVDGTVAQVLTGDIDTAAVAHDATEQLEQARAELDHARTSIDSQVRELDQVRAARKHQERLQDLDVLLEHTPTHLASVVSVLEQVGLNVTDPTTLPDTSDAVAAVESAIATAEHVDRTHPRQVADRLATITSTRASLDRQMASLTESHQAWVGAQNIEITAHNDTLLEAHDTAIEQAREQHLLDNRAQVAKHSNGWSGQPTGVSGSNGRLAWESLCELEFAPQHRLQCDAAASLTAANAQYFAHTGKDLVLTDSYRSYSLQVRTRALKPRTAARPGTSNHGWGMAIDMDRESALWLAENGADFGWVHPDWAGTGGIRPEWWHLEYVATSVGAFEAPPPATLKELVVSVFDSQPDPNPHNFDNTQPTSADARSK